MYGRTDSVAQRWLPREDGRARAVVDPGAPENVLFMAAAERALQTGEIAEIVSANEGARLGLREELDTALRRNGPGLFVERIEPYNRLVRNLRSDPADQPPSRPLGRGPATLLALHGGALALAGTGAALLGAVAIYLVFTSTPKFHADQDWVGQAAAFGTLALAAGTAFLATGKHDRYWGRWVWSRRLAAGLRTVFSAGAWVAGLTGIFSVVATPWLSFQSWMGLAFVLAVGAAIFVAFLSDSAPGTYDVDRWAVASVAVLAGTAALLAGAAAAVAAATPRYGLPDWLPVALSAGVAGVVVGLSTVAVEPDDLLASPRDASTLPLTAGLSAGIVVGAAVAAAGAGTPWQPVALPAGALAAGALYGLALSRYPQMIAGPPRPDQFEERAVREWVTDFADNVVLPFLRQQLNQLLSRVDDVRLEVRSINGLRESQNPDHDVPTQALRQLRRLFKYMDAGSIGIAGPRGVGKSTLMRLASTEHGRGEDGRGAGLGSLAVTVSAPVEYTARDFVLHLFDQVCTGYLLHRGAPLSRPGRSRRALAAGAWAVGWLAAGVLLVITRNAAARALLPWLDRHGLSAHLQSWRDDVPTVLGVAGALVAVAAINGARRRRRRRRMLRPDPLIEAARAHLDRIRLLQTYTSGWSGGVKAGPVDAKVTSGLAAAQQPLTYPEIVSACRGFLAAAAAAVAADGNTVFVGIDELDRIPTGDRARQFLDEVKGIFDVPNTYFLVSVSEDALVSFERRGMPLRDSFDSAFDEIIRVEPLDFRTACTVLERRVVGMPMTFIALCFALSGGIPRDLIRFARRLVAVDTADGDDLATLSRRLVDDEYARRAKAAAAALPPGPLEPTLYDTMLAVRGGSLAAGLEVAGQVRPVPLGAPRLPLTEPVDPDAGGPDHFAAWGLVEELAAYAVFCDTLITVFKTPMSAEEVQKAAGGTGPESFAGLARARQAFAGGPYQARKAVVEVRTAWLTAPRPRSPGAAS